MNIKAIVSLVPQLPSLLRETFKFMQWSIGQHLSQVPEDYDEDDEFVEFAEPLTMNEAGRIALEFIMVGRLTQHKPEEFREMMSEVVDGVDNPQHAIDVIMTLAGMVNVLADDDDLQHFGEHILHNEAAQR